METSCGLRVAMKSKTNSATTAATVAPHSTGVPMVSSEPEPAVGAVDAGSASAWCRDMRVLSVAAA